MDLENSFVVPAGIDVAWETLLDVQAIAPCMPGATLTSFDGDNFTADVKVKLGPVTMTYGGVGKFIERDETTHTAVIEGLGKESRGSGTAKALITTRLVSESADRTRVEVHTDLTITGKAAQFGRGVMADVSKRLIGQFATNLEQVIVARNQPAPPASSSADSTPSIDEAQAPRIVAADSIDLLGTAGAPVLKRAIPVIVGVVVVVGVVVWLARRRGASAR